MVCLFWDAIYGLKNQGEGCWDNDWENKLFSVYRIVCFHVVVWPSKRLKYCFHARKRYCRFFWGGVNCYLRFQFTFSPEIQKKDTQNDTMIFGTHHVWYPCLMVKVDSCIYVMREEKNIQVVFGGESSSKWSNFSRSTLPKTSIAPKNWWLVDVSASPREYFQVV